MREPMMQEQARRFGKVLDAAEKAWTDQDFDALDKASNEVPDGFVLCIYNFQQGCPCFSITPVESVRRNADGFRCVEARELALRRLQQAGSEPSTEPDRSSEQPGVSSSVEPPVPDDRGNL